jgi:hypothetical protein
MKLSAMMSATVCSLFFLGLAAPAVAQNDPAQPVLPKYAVHPPQPIVSAPAPPAVYRDHAAVTTNFASPSPTAWTALGPAPLNAGVPWSGRIAGVAVDPTNASTIYVAAAGGGVWKTIDGGTTYTPLTDNQTVLSMGAIAVAPSNSQKIYAGTGEANNSADSNYGAGILISGDGGATWTLSTGPSGVFNRLTVSKISVHPTNANIAYAAIANIGENSVLLPNTGIYKTSDGGTTWVNTTTSIDSTTPWSDVVVDPNTPNIIYAGKGAYYGVATNGLYRSLDSGSTWALVSGVSSGSSTGRFALAIAPSASTATHHVLYVAITSSSSYALLSMLRSDNADIATPTFTALSSTPNFGGGQGWYDWMIGVDPSNSANIYAAGSVPYNVIRSTDSGTTWTNISTVGTVTPHTDSHAIVFDSSNRLLLGTDGGIWRYDSTVPSWTNLNGNLNTIQFTGIGMHPTLSGTVVGGSQDNGTELTTGNQIWTITDGGDGGYSQFSQTNPSICYSNHPIESFGSTAFFRVSADGCQTFSSKTPTVGNANNFDFYAPIFVDPSNGNRVFLGGDKLYESLNAGTSWTSHAVPTNPIDTVAVLPGGQTIYIATGGTFATNSAIYVSIDDGVTWVAHSLPSGGRVQEIDIDPNDATGNTAVAVLNSFSTALVYRTTNGGALWTSITANLPVVPTWSAKIDTDTSRTIYISNEQGVYSSKSPYTTWSTVGTGLPHAQGVHLELNSTLHVLSLATHGRGAWYFFTPSVAPAITSAASTTFTVGTAGTFTITTTGQPVPTLSETGSLPSGVTFVDNGNGTATLAGTPAAGTGGVYTLTITAQNGLAPNATQTFTLTVNQAPAITSASSTTFVLNSAGTFTVTTSGYPRPALSKTGALPAGVTFTDNGIGTATLQGTPTAAGTFSLTLTANNGVSPNASQSFTLTVLTPPTISFSVPKKHDFDAPFTVSASSNSAGALTYLVTSGPASVLGSTVTLTGATGTVQMEVDQAASGGFTSGSQTTSFAVTKGSVLLVNSGSAGLGEFDLTGLPFTSSAAYTGAGLQAATSGANIAVDASGSLWIANPGTTGVSKFTGSGVAVNSTPYSGSNAPGGVAIDGSGKVWIANGNGTIVVLSSTGATLTTLSDTGLSTPKGVAIDSSGSVWVANKTNSTVDEIIGGAAPTAPLAAGTPGVKP